MKNLNFKYLAIFILGTLFISCSNIGDPVLPEETSESITFNKKPENLSKQNSILSDGFIAYFPFNGDANDVSDNNNHGTVYGATWTTGQVDGALNFDGVNNDYVEVPHSPSLEDIVNEITIEAWVYINDFPTADPWYNMQVLQKNGSIYEHAYAMPILGELGIFQGSGIRKPRRFGLELTLDGQWSGHLLSGGTWSNTLLEEHVWYHLAATYDGSSIKLYLNGELDASYSISGQIETNNYPVRIGNWLWNDWDRFNGVLDEVALHDRALSHEEIQHHYQNGLQGLGYIDLVTQASIDIDPDVLNLNCNGKWVTAYIELPDGYDVAEIDVGTVTLEGTIPAEAHPTEVGDYDKDGIPDLKVKFARKALIEYLGGTTGDVTLTVSGKLNNNTPIEGSDTIRVINPGKKYEFYYSNTIQPVVGK